MKVSVVDGYDIAVKLQHIVFIFKVEADLFVDLSVKASQFFDESKGRKNKKTFGASDFWLFNQ